MLRRRLVGGWTAQTKRIKMKVVSKVMHSEAYAGETFRPNYIPHLCLKCKRVFKSRFKVEVDKFCPLCSVKMEELSEGSIYCPDCKAYSVPSRYLQFQPGTGPYPLMKAIYNVEGCASCFKLWLDNHPLEEG